MNPLELGPNRPIMIDPCSLEAFLVLFGQFGRLFDAAVGFVQIPHSLHGTLVTLLRTLLCLGIIAR